jgi:hypothetical protein
MTTNEPPALYALQIANSALRLSNHPLARIASSIISRQLDSRQGGSTFERPLPVDSKPLAQPSGGMTVDPVGSSDSMQSCELSTRQFVDTKDFCGYFLMLDKDPFAVQLTVNGHGFRGYYDLSRLPLSTRFALLDDEATPVPVVLQRLSGKPGFERVAVEVHADIPRGLPTLKPWRNDPFK